MDNKTCIIYRGQKFTVEWFYDNNGKSVAYDFFMESSENIQDKLFILVKRMAEFGKISDKTRFRNEGDGIYAFKPQPDRYLSFFTDKKKIIITNGCKKKTDKLPKNEKKMAMDYRKDYLERNKGEKNNGNNIWQIN